MGSGLSPMLPTAKPLPAEASIDMSASGILKRDGSCVRCVAIRLISEPWSSCPTVGRSPPGSEDRTIRLWNPKTGEPTKLLFTRYDHNVCSLSLSPDGLMLARGSHNKDIKIWEVTTGTDLMTLLGKDQYDHHWSVCVAFSPDGMHLASGSDIGKIRIWEVLPSGEEKILHNGHWEETEEDSTETRGFFIEDDGGFQKPMEYWIGAMVFTPDAKILDHRKPGQYDPFL